MAASILGFAVLALLAVAHQSSAAGISLQFPSIFGGGSYTSQTIPSSQTGGKVGVSLEINGRSVTRKLELGPLGGQQCKLLSPLLPNMDQILININKAVDDFNNAANEVRTNIGNFFSNPFKAIQDAASKIQQDINNTINGILNLEFKLPEMSDFEKIVKNLNLVNIPGLNNFTAIANNTNDLLLDLVKTGALNQEELVSFASDVLYSALNQSQNSLALLTDTVDASLKNNILDHAKALEILSEAIRQNLQESTESGEKAVSDFLDTLSASSIISSDLASQLKSVMKTITNTSIANIENSVSVENPVSNITDAAKNSTETFKEATTQVESLTANSVDSSESIADETEDSTTDATINVVTVNSE